MAIVSKLTSDRYCFGDLLPKLVAGQEGRVERSAIKEKESLSFWERTRGDGTI